MKLSKLIMFAGILLIFLGISFAFISSKIENKKFIESIIINNKVEHTNEFENLKKIVVKADIGRINLLESKNNKVSYQYHGLFANTFKSDVVSKVLLLESSSINLVSFANTETLQLNIYIPKTNKIDVIIENSGANVEVDNIQLHSLSIKSDMGMTSIKNSAINDKLIAYNRVGTILIKNVKEPKNIYIQNTIGSIKLKNMYGQNVYLRNDVGTLSFINSNKMYSFNNLEVDVSVGKQTIKVK